MRRVARYRNVSADIEGEIDSDLDSGSTTFCCIPRFVARRRRGPRTLPEMERRLQPAAGNDDFSLYPVPERGPKTKRYRF